MNKLIRNSLASIILLALVACNVPGGGPREVLPNESSVLRLTVQTENNVSTYNQADEVINVQYVITNTGTTRLAEPVLVSDVPRQVICPALSTVGNNDIYLDQNETVNCTASYRTTASDVNTGSITIQAVASAGGIASNQGRLTLTRGQEAPSNLLRLEKTADTQTYGAANESITFTFTITNIGTTNLGPAQFTITDNKLGAPFNCGPADATLGPNQAVSCSMPYTTTAADMTLVNITNSATAAGAGQTSAPGMVTITNLLAPATETPPTPATAIPPSDLTPGSTVQHRVAVGEWIVQIARCYGANFKQVIAANPQIDDPDFIRPEVDVVTVPNIGSVGRIYKSDTVPCVTFHTVVSGDTWASLAQTYNADQTVLQLANPGGLIVGKQAKIPLNSAGGGPVAVTPGVTPNPTTGSTASAPMQITFDPGSTTARRIGFVNLNERIQYLVTAAPGQLLTINLEATANEVTIGVNDPNGLALKSPDSNYTWSAAVNTAGNYTINITGLAGGSTKSYTLTVSLTTPAAATAQPTATQTPLTPIP